MRHLVIAAAALLLVAAACQRTAGSDEAEFPDRASTGAAGAVTGARDPNPSGAGATAEAAQAAPGSTDPGYGPAPR
jgi:hypothetical protein